MGKMKQRENESGEDKIKPGIKLSVRKCAFNMLAFASLESTWPFVELMWIGNDQFHDSLCS